jgi:hypothetical protein
MSCLKQYQSCEVFSIYCYQTQNNGRLLSWALARQLNAFICTCLQSYIYVVIMFCRINKNSLVLSHDLKKIVVWLPFNTSPDKCPGWRQVEAAVVLGRQLTVVELKASVNTNSLHCSILTQIQIQGGDGKKSFELWGRRCWRLASVWRQTFWYVPRSRTLLLIPTYVWTGNKPVHEFIECHTDGNTWALLFDFRHVQEIFVLYRVPTSPPTHQTPTHNSAYQCLPTKVKIPSHVHMVLRLRMRVVVPYRFVIIDKCCFILLWNLCNMLYIIYIRVWWGKLK